MLAALVAKGDSWPPVVERFESSKELIKFAFRKISLASAVVRIIKRIISEDEVKNVSHRGNEQK